MTPGEPPPAAAFGFTNKAALWWKKNGSALTQVRRILCDTIAGMDATFHADQLLAEARKKDGLVSPPSVYRTLASLVEAGLLVEIEGIDNRSHYHIATEKNPNTTSTIVCEDCGKLIPVENPCLQVKEGPIAHQEGFSARRISIRYEASCDELHQSGECKRSGKARKTL